MLAAQAAQYRLFHMTDPQVFSNQEDRWQFPEETYGGGTHLMHPYYALMKLPDSRTLEYLLMTPFAAHSQQYDLVDGRRMWLVRLWKDRGVQSAKEQAYLWTERDRGAHQSKTLWDQRGSRVIRGKQIVTPIENSFLYVVPLYLTSTSIPFPELKRVIAVADGGGSRWGRPWKPPSRPVHSAAAASCTPPQTSKSQPAAAASQPSLDQARSSLDQAMKALQQGRWEKFGKAIDSLEQRLDVHFLSADP